MWWPALHTTGQLRYGVFEGTLLPPSLLLVFSLNIAFFQNSHLIFQETFGLLSVSESSVYACGVSGWESVLKLAYCFYKASLQEYA